MGEEASGYQLSRTGLIYDPLMLEFHCQWDEQYPEKPDRVQKPYERCQLYGLSQKCVSLPGRMATDAEIETCHTARVNQLMKESENMSEDELKHLSTQYDSMFWHQKSNNAARYALGSSIDLMDNIMTGKVDNGFAIIRPPGHHAMRDEPNGYCYFNNAAVVARTAIDKYNLKRVLILDWDVHHGQGTQFQFYDDPRVLYVSWHRYDHAAFWPNLRQSDFDFIGDKEGKGFNINIPLNKTGFGDSEYLDSFFNLILPMAYEFDPELIIVSCGYDAAIGCFEGRMRITPACYAHFLNALSCFTNGKLCVLLEGGYCIKSLSEGVALAVRALLGYPCPRIEDNVKSDPIFAETIKNLILVLRPYWKSLQALNDPDESISLKTYLANWDKQYREGVKYYSVENPPKEFALTGFYPLYSDAENQALDKEIDDLIQKTDLSVAPTRTHVCSGRPVDSDSGLDGNLVETVSQIASKQTTNGVAVLSEKVELDKVAHFIRNRHSNIKKILTIQISDEYSRPQQDESSVNFVLGSSKSSSSSQVTRSEISFNFGANNDAAYMTAFLRIAMPVSYQFNPDLVIFLVDSTDMPISTLAFAHHLRLAQALAAGNILLLLRNKSVDELKDQSISILKGDVCPKFQMLVADDSDKKTIKSIIQKLQNDWSCLQYNDKLPKPDDDDKQ